MEKIQKLAVLAQNAKAAQDERGAAAVEYGLLVALIAVAIIAIVTALGLALAGKFGTVVTALGG
jgi:pilus assembly protein Flp/PilA